MKLKLFFLLFLSSCTSIPTHNIQYAERYYYNHKSDLNKIVELAREYPEPYIELQGSDAKRPFGVELPSVKFVVGRIREDGNQTLGIAFDFDTELPNGTKLALLYDSTITEMLAVNNAPSVTILPNCKKSSVQDAFVSMLEQRSATVFCIIEEKWYARETRRNQLSSEQ